MQTRLQLAALDHNKKVDRKEVEDTEGNPLVRQVYSKKKKNWYLRNVYQENEYTYLDLSLAKIVERRADTSVCMDDTSSRLELPELRPSLAKTEKPDLRDVLEHRYKRMGNKES